MTNRLVKIYWPNGRVSYSEVGQSWLEAASINGITIPTGCLSGSCGACEIEVNGKIVRSCISDIANTSANELNIEISYDPYW